MKVRYNAGHGKSMLVSSAVQHKLIPTAYSYEGQLEKIKRAVELQSELIGELVERLADKGKLNKNDLEAILGYSYEIVDD